MLDWEKQIVRRVMEGAGEFPGVQLELLLRRLESYPHAAQVIPDAMDDMSRWYQAQAVGARAEIQRRNGRVDVVTLDPEGGAE